MKLEFIKEEIVFALNNTWNKPLDLIKRYENYIDIFFLNSLDFFCKILEKKLYVKFSFNKLTLFYMEPFLSFIVLWVFLLTSWQNIGLAELSLEFAKWRRNGISHVCKVNRNLQIWFHIIEIMQKSLLIQSCLPCFSIFYPKPGVGGGYHRAFRLQLCIVCKKKFQI